MRIANWLTAGFDSYSLLCVGFHIHPEHREVSVDFFGFYVNAYLGRG